MLSVKQRRPAPAPTSELGRPNHMQEEIEALRAQLREKEAEISVVRERIQVLQSGAKAFFYAAGMTFAAFICLSNSLTAVAQTLWSDVGNNWAYMWGYMQDRISVPTIYALTFVLHIVVYWTFGLILAYFDVYKPHVLAQFKVQPGTNSPVSWDKFKRTCLGVLFNQFCVAGPAIFVSWYVFKYTGLRMVLPLPSFNRVLFELLMFSVVKEVMFYYVHRGLHHRSVYGYIHKVHHEWNAPIGVAALYCHPFEHLVANTLPTLVSTALFGTHLCTLWVIVVVGAINVVNSHSGYHLPFMTSPQAHDFHHLKFTQNYGIFGVLDYLHGTDAEWRKSEQYKLHETFFDMSYQPPASYKAKKTAAAADDDDFAAATAAADPTAPVCKPGGACVDTDGGGCAGGSGRARGKCQVE